MATGVLPLVIGRATRLAQFLAAERQGLRSDVAFGRDTDTYDATGEIVRRVADRAQPATQLEAALARFRGTFEQTPPAYSAKNIGGERAYDLARGGQDGATRDRSRCRSTVRELELLAVRRRPREPARCRCRRGSTCARWPTTSGRRSACGAVLTALRRTRSGGSAWSDAVPFEVVAHEQPRHALPRG